jgi:hypothetical protein
MRLAQSCNLCRVANLQDSRRNQSSLCVPWSLPVLGSPQFVTLRLLTRRPRWLLRPARLGQAHALSVHCHDPRQTTLYRPFTDALHAQTASCDTSAGTLASRSTQQHPAARCCTASRRPGTPRPAWPFRHSPPGLSCCTVLT